MHDAPPPGSRRTALKHLLLGAGILAASPHRVRSAELPHLAESDPQAMKVGYVEVAAKADRTKYPGFDPVQACENCLQLQGAAGAGYRPCQLFPGKSVAIGGWCSDWTPEI